MNGVESGVLLMVVRCRGGLVVGPQVFARRPGDEAGRRKKRRDFSGLDSDWLV